jgi:plastocyanin
MRGLKFIPQSVTAHVGQTVKWVNQDTVSHNVTASNGQTFMSPTFGPGGSFTYTPKVAGTIAYTCTIHPNMLGTLIVQ